jgi:hypothetical protein
MPQQNKKWTLHEEAALQEGIARSGPLYRGGTHGAKYTGRVVVDPLSCTRNRTDGITWIRRQGVGVTLQAASNVCPGSLAQGQRTVACWLRYTCLTGLTNGRPARGIEANGPGTHQAASDNITIVLCRHGAGRWHFIKHDPQLKFALAQRSNIDLKVNTARSMPCSVHKAQGLHLTTCSASTPPQLPRSRPRRLHVVHHFHLLLTPHV